MMTHNKGMKADFFSFTLFCWAIKRSLVHNGQCDRSLFRLLHNKALIPLEGESLATDLRSDWSIGPLSHDHCRAELAADLGTADATILLILIP